MSTSPASFRALKFNLPWSSYRPGRVMTLHQETCRSQDYWAALIDMLAANGFNVLSLWSMHPFDLMIRPSGFEYACSLSDAELATWRDLWRFIFGRCREKGIDSYLITWNIFVSPAFAERHDIAFPGPEYLWGAGDTSERVKEYNRQCITQTLDTYEDLTGFGSALGDRMQNLSHTERLAWFEDVIYPAVRAAGRPVNFVQRAPFRGDPQTTREAIERANLPGHVYVEYKFNWSHAHSTPHLCMMHDELSIGDGQFPQVDDRLWNPPPERYKIVWTARNEDFFILRWGEPDFVREHIATNMHEYVAGYFVGAEGNIPAAELAHKAGPHVDWRYAFERQWLFYMVWGRLLQDPATPDAVFEQEFAERYGADVGPAMLDAYRRASRMPLRLASFHGATWDYTLYCEGFLTPFASLAPHDGKPFLGIDEFIAGPTLDPRLVSIPEFVAGQTGPDRLSPLELADRSEDDGQAVLEAVAALRRLCSGRPGSFACELDDLETWGHLSHYLAEKLRGGVALHRFRLQGQAEDQARAVSSLQAAANHWEQVIRVTEAHYQPVPYYEREGVALRFAWSDYRQAVQDDVETARSATCAGQKQD